VKPVELPRTERGNILKKKINEIETHSKNKNIRVVKRHK
jgi:hypothetical protein